MYCGNNPRARLTDVDRAWIDWFAAWLTWSKTRDDGGDAGPEPVQPDGLLATTGKAPTDEH